MRSCLHHCIENVVTMRKTSSQLDWSLFVSFHCSDAPDYVSDSIAYPISNDNSTCYKWTPAMGDVSLFSLDGFSVSQHSHLTLSLKLQPRLKVLSNSNPKQAIRMAIGRIRWFNVDIPTSDLIYETIASENNPHVKGGVGGRRRSSFYFTGPPVVSGPTDLDERGKLKRKKFSKTVLNGEAMLEMEYEAMRYFDPAEGGHVGQILILNTTVVMRSTDALYRMICKTGHRITCQVQLMRREPKKRVQLNKVYLGRAQEITTTQDNVRKLVWKSDIETGAGHFPGLTPRSPTQRHFEQHQEEMQDMQMIRMLFPDIPHKHNKGDLSARYSISMPTEYIPDHDDYSNPTHRLPVFFEQNQQMTLKFFNFKFTPPRCVEHVLRWCDFEAADKRELMSPRMHLESAEVPKQKKKRWLRNLFSVSNGNGDDAVEGKKKKKQLQKQQQQLRMLERPLGKDISIRVFFHKDTHHTSRMKLDAIAFIANDYEQALDMNISNAITM